MEVGGGARAQKQRPFPLPAFDYGAVSEDAEGDWTFDGKTVRLTSMPMPKAPSFELVRDDPAPVGESGMKLEHAGLRRWTIGSTPLLPSDSGRRGGIDQPTTDGRVEAGSHKLTSIEPLVPVYGIVGGSFPAQPGARPSPAAALSRK